MYDIASLGDGLVVVASLWNLDGASDAGVHVLDSAWTTRYFPLAKNARGVQYLVRHNTVYAIYAVFGSAPDAEIKFGSLNTETGSLDTRDLGRSDAQVLDRTLGDVVVFGDHIYAGWVTSEAFHVQRFSLELRGPDASWASKRPAGLRPRLAAGDRYLYVALLEESEALEESEIVVLGGDLTESRRVKAGRRFGIQMAFSPGACTLVTSGAETFDGRSFEPLPGIRYDPEALYYDVRVSGRDAYLVTLKEESLRLALTRLPRTDTQCGL